MTKKVQKKSKNGEPMFDADGKPIMVEVEVEEENPESEDEDEDEGENEEDLNDRERLEAWVAEQDEETRAMYQKGIDGLLSALNKERDAAKEAARLKKELDKYKTEEERELETQQATIAELSESLDEAKTAREKAEKALVDTQISFAVTTGALKQGFADPEDAQKLLPEGSVKYNKKTNKVEGAEEALKELAEAKPYLLGSEGVGTPRKSKDRKPGDPEAEPSPVSVKF